MPFVALTLLVWLAAPAGAAAGQLDKSFGKKGKVLTNFGTDYDFANGVAIESSGRIVAVGFARSGTNGDFALGGYKTSGELDHTFGTDGKVFTDFGGFDGADAVAIDGSGNLVVAGFVGALNSDQIAVARYDADGAADSTFGVGGKVIVTVGAFSEASAVAIQSDGKILVGGLENATANGTDGNFVLVRLDSKGLPDPTFGQAGIVTTSLGSGFDRINAVAVQLDGKIVVAGNTQQGSDRDVALARYTTAGVLDDTFGTGGVVTERLSSGDDSANGTALQKDGKVVVAGCKKCNGPKSRFALLRFTASGTLDTGFGKGGKALTNFGPMDDEAFAVVLLPKGKIVAAGSEQLTQNDFAFALARYKKSGHLDTLFGTHGKVTTQFGDQYDAVNALALQKDGRIVAAGDGGPGQNSQFALARYQSA